MLKEFFQTKGGVEALALLQGLRRLKLRGIERVRIIGYSQSIIRLLVKNLLPKDLILKQLVNKIKSISATLSSLHYLHVLITINLEAAIEAHRVVGHLPSELLGNERENEWDPLP